MRALIAEDEPLLANGIRDALARAWPELEICAIVHDGQTAWREFERLKPDIVFLDVQMPGLSGLELARLIGAQAHRVFITAFAHFAVSAFDEGAVDYLLKPLDAARLALCVQRLKQRQAQPPADLEQLLARLSRLEAAMPAPAQQAPLRWLTVQQGRDLLLVTVDDILYLQADNKYVAVVTAEREALVSSSLKELQQRLDPEIFWRVHRGTVVNITAVRSIHRGLGGRLRLHLRERDETLAVGPDYAHLFRQW